MRSTGVQLSFREELLRPDVCTRRIWPGLAVEAVRIASARSFEYRWQGNLNYLAVHDIALVDGEIAIGDELRANRSDLRERLTFVPPNMPVTGWSQLAGQQQGYTAMFFDPDLAEAELERPLLGVAPRPLLYFENAALGVTLRRLAQLIMNEQKDDALAAETLGLIAVLQLYPSFGLSRQPDAGQLGLVQQRSIQDFVEAHLQDAITLSDLAAVAGLSRYHFARSFSRTYGKPPHQHVLMRRIGEAASLLATTIMPISEITRRVGFSSPARLSTAFRRLTGHTPSRFREILQ